MQTCTYVYARGSHKGLRCKRKSDTEYCTKHKTTRIAHGLHRDASYKLKQHDYAKYNRACTHKIITKRCWSCAAKITCKHGKFKIRCDICKSVDEPADGEPDDHDDEPDDHDDEPDDPMQVCPDRPDSPEINLPSAHDDFEISIDCDDI